MSLLIINMSFLCLDTFIVANALCLVLNFARRRVESLK